MVEQLARFLGVSCDKAQLESLTEHCHQLVDQCCNAEALPVGRGTRLCPPPSASAQGPAPRPAAVVPHIVFCLPVSRISRALCPAGGQRVIWKLGLLAAQPQRSGLLLLCVVTQQTC